MHASRSSELPAGAGGDDLSVAITRRALVAARDRFLRIGAEINETVRDLENALAALDGRSSPATTPRLFSIADVARAEEINKSAAAKRLGRLPEHLKGKRIKKSGQNLLPEEVALAMVSTEGARALARVAMKREASQLSDVNVAPVLSPSPAVQPIVSSTESLGFRERDNDADEL